MKYFGTGLSEKHKELSRIIRRTAQLEEAKSLFLDIHAALHLAQVSGGSEPNEVDRLLGDLQESEYAIMPTPKDETIAWAIWHIARLEDLTMNILIADREQVFNGEWRRRLNSPITDTGNACTDEQIMALSRSLKIPELLCYRSAVGRRTREMVRGMTAEDMKRKVTKSGLDRIAEEGGVTSQEDSIWLLEYWSSKDAAGLLLMPPTRDTMLHLNDCCKWKTWIRTKQSADSQRTGGKRN